MFKPIAWINRTRQTVPPSESAGRQRRFSLWSVPSSSSTLCSPCFKTDSGKRHWTAFHLKQCGNSDPLCSQCEITWFLFFLNWWYRATTLWPQKCQSWKHPALFWLEDLIMMDLHGFEVEREKERRGLLSAKRKLSVPYVGLRNEKVSLPLLLPEHLSGRGCEMSRSVHSVAPRRM